ncbi:MAG: bifunctional diguanylate cyclase/phosphodiesterase, partial [Pseudomonadota bacterium]
GARARHNAMRAAIRPLRHALTRARRGDPDPSLNVSPRHPMADVASLYNAVVRTFGDRVHELEHQHKYDALTGLATRAEVRERITCAVERARAGGQTLAAVVMDVARFGEINSTFGHEAGDHVLKVLAGRLANVTRVGDVAARVGGDELMLLLSGVDADEAASIAHVLIESLEAPVEVQGKTLSLAVRAGIALYPDHGETARALRRMANVALITAKQTRQSCVVFETGQDEQHLRELAIIHDLPGALRDGELYLQYQPKIDMASQQVEMVEALVRWRHPQLGFVPPDEFIGLLERAGQIAQLTRWVFDEAIRQTREWMDNGYDIGVAVNISANDLQDENLATQVVERLRHYAVDPSRLSIEVTESAVIDDPERAIGVLREFRKAGLTIALDDFGTGQTSLSLLKQLPLSHVKIDKAFVQHLRADSGDAIIVKSIIDLGHNMGLLVTAEGVESNYCWNLLNSYNCDFVQGYLVSAPLTADELRTWYLKLQKRHETRLDFNAVQGNR